jgi:hypothetical protein
MNNGGLEISLRTLDVGQWLILGVLVTRKSREICGSARAENRPETFLTLIVFFIRVAAQSHHVLEDHSRQRTFL